MSEVYWGKYKAYLFLGLFSLAVVLFQYTLEIKYSWDSNWYILFSDWIGNSFNFDRLAVYPPLYYLSLGLLESLGLNIVSSILVYWWISYFLILIVFFSITRSSLLSILGLITIISNPKTLSMFRYVWTELGYSVILMIATYLLFKILTEDKSKKYKVIFLISIALLPTQRYIGAYISTYLGLIYLFSNRNYILNRLSELLVATLPLLFLFAWNLLLTGHIAGPRTASSIPMMKNFILTQNVLFNVFRPEWLFLLITILVLAIISWKKRKFNILLLLLFIPFIQSFFQVLSNTMYAINGINPRYFIVFSPVIVLLITLVIDALVENKKRMLISIATIFILLTGFNFWFSNNKHYTYITNNHIYSDEKIKSFLGNIKNSTTVGIFTGGGRHLSAEYILTSKIIPYMHCQKYKVVGNLDKTKKIST
jgi:hypothetical protein